MHLSSLTGETLLSPGKESLETVARVFVMAASFVWHVLYEIIDPGEETLI